MALPLADEAVRVSGRLFGQPTFRSALMDLSVGEWIGCHWPVVGLSGECRYTASFGLSATFDALTARQVQRVQKGHHSMIPSMPKFSSSSPRLQRAHTSAHPASPRP